MATEDEADLHCQRLVAEGDEDFHLSLPYAPDGDRRRLCATFAFLIELRRIPHAVSEAPLGEIRLQWWREALAAIVAGRAASPHPVTRALRESSAVTPAFLAAAEQMIDGRARLLYEPAFASVDDLRAFLAAAEAPIATLCSGRPFAPMGEAYALARFAPIFAPSVAAQAAATAGADFAALAARQGLLGPDDAGRAPFLALTRGYASRPDGRRWPLAKRLALFRAVLTGRV